MGGDRSYSDLDIIAYETRGRQQRVKPQRSSSIRTNHARKSSIGNNGSSVRRNETRSRSSYQQSYNYSNNIKPIQTIHTKDRNRGNRAGSSNAKVQKKPYDVRESRKASQRRKRRQRAFAARFVCALSICIVAGCAGMGIYRLFFEKEQLGESKITDLSAFTESVFQKEESWTIEEVLAALEQEGIPCTQDFLTPNEYSRPGDALKKVNNIFVHYTANPATSAAQNRSYFDNLALTHETSASAHFIIGYEGELVQCIPLEEIAYAVAGRNEDSISIECCYLDEDGEFTDETYTTLVHFTARLLQKYGLEAEDLRRHYDEGGKACPKYYVENEDEWWNFVREVKVYKMTLQDG